jgi:tyrosyl-tRNA synthetase
VGYQAAGTLGHQILHGVSPVEIYGKSYPVQLKIESINAFSAHAGMDQRKVQVIAREVANSIKTRPLMHNGRKIKPIVIHNPLLPGLQKPAEWPVSSSRLKELSFRKMKMYEKHS